MNNNRQVTFEDDYHQQEKDKGMEKNSHHNSKTSLSKNQFSFGLEEDRQMQQRRRKQDRSKMKSKLEQVNQLLYELVFLKESVTSAVAEQRIKMTDFMRDLKKYLFQFEIKSQRQTMVKSRKQGDVIADSPSASKQSTQQDQTVLQLQHLCESLTIQNQQLRFNYEQMLVKYQSEIQMLTEEIAPHEDQDFTRLTQQNRELRTTIQEIQQTLRNQQDRFVEKIKYLESQIVDLSDEYLKEKQHFQTTLETYRQQEREFSFREGEIERKNILLLERERQITERQIMMKQEKTTLDRREVKISDFQHNQLRREKLQTQQDKSHLKSQYYMSYARLPDQRNDSTPRFEGIRYPERQNSMGSSRFITSKVEINARLREIQMQRKRTGLKGSRISESGLARLNRSSSRDRNQFMGLQGKKPVVSGENVNIKLESMLQLMQRDLNDIK